MKWKFYIVPALVIGAIAASLLGASPARAVDSPYTLVCQEGAQPTIGNFFNNGKIVGCSVGDIKSEQDKTPQDGVFKLVVSCSGPTNATQDAAHNPERWVFSACPDGNPPAISSASTGAAFQGDCNGGNGVKLGVGINGSGECVGDQDTNPIYAYLKGIIIFVSGIFGILVVLMIIVSGIQYMTSSGNPQAVANAKKRLGNAILGIILFSFMVAILNYLIPGGLF